MSSSASEMLALRGAPRLDSPPAIIRSSRSKAPTQHCGFLKEGRRRGAKPHSRIEHPRRAGGRWIKPALRILYSTNHKYSSSWNSCSCMRVQVRRSRFERGPVILFWVVYLNMVLGRIINSRIPPITYTRPLYKLAVCPIRGEGISFSLVHDFSRIEKDSTIELGTMRSL